MPATSSRPHSAATSPPAATSSAPIRCTRPTATSVRMRAGKRVVTDGPFAETREQFGGYFLVDAKDRD